MIHTAKGLIGVLKNIPIIITSKDITKWNLENASITQTICNLTHFSHTQK